MPPAEGRTVLLPSDDWAHTGEILGRAASFLDTSDNSVVVIAVQETERAEVVCPPAGSTIVFPDSEGRETLRFRVDDDLLRNVAIWAGERTSFSVDTFEETSAPFHCVPIVSEVARLRRRGTPLLTPIVLSQGMWSVESIVELGVYLAQLQADDGLSLIFVSDRCTTIGDEHDLALPLESLVPSFLDRQEGMEAPTLFQAVCGAAESSVRAVGRCKSVEGDIMLSHWAYGAVRDTRAHSVVPWRLRPAVWASLCKGEVFGELLIQGMAILSLSEGGRTVFRRSSCRPGDLFDNLSIVGAVAAAECGGRDDLVAKVSLPHAIRELDVRRETFSRLIPGDDGLMLKADGVLTLLAPDESAELGLGPEGMVETIHERAGVRRGTGKVWSFKTQDLVAPWRLALEVRP